MKSMKLSFDVVLSSPLVRAHQTAEAVQKSLRFAQKIGISTNLAPGAKPTGDKPLSPSSDPDWNQDPTPHF